MKGELLETLLAKRDATKTRRSKSASKSSSAKRGRRGGASATPSTGRGNGSKPEIGDVVAGREVLDEEDYEVALEEIVARSFFPDLPRLRLQEAYMEAVEAGDSRRITEIGAPCEYCCRTLFFFKIFFFFWI